jgi:hypothetical protein
MSLLLRLWLANRLLGLGLIGAAMWLVPSAERERLRRLRAHCRPGDAKRGADWRVRRPFLNRK